jgi:hypothetical protein
MPEDWCFKRCGWFSGFSTASRCPLRISSLNVASSRIYRITHLLRRWVWITMCTLSNWRQLTWQFRLSPSIVFSHRHKKFLWMQIRCHADVGRMITAWQVTTAVNHVLCNLYGLYRLPTGNMHLYFDLCQNRWRPNLAQITMSPGSAPMPCLVSIIRPGNVVTCQIYCCGFSSGTFSFFYVFVVVRTSITGVLSLPLMAQLTRFGVKSVLSLQYALNLDLGFTVPQKRGFLPWIGFSSLSDQRDRSCNIWIRKPTELKVSRNFAVIRPFQQKVTDVEYFYFYMLVKLSAVCLVTQLNYHYHYLNVAKSQITAAASLKNESGYKSQSEICVAQCLKTTNTQNRIRNAKFLKKR